MGTPEFGGAPIQGSLKAGENFFSAGHKVFFPMEKGSMEVQWPMGQAAGMPGAFGNQAQVETTNFSLSPFIPDL